MLNKIFKVFCAALTALLLLSYDSLPKNTLVLYPNLTELKHASTDLWNGGKSFLTWGAEEPVEWTCHLRKSDVYPYCGMYLTWSKKSPFSGIDLSTFSEFSIQLDYQGEAEYLQVFLRNDYPMANTDGKQISKYASAGINAKTLTEAVNVSFDDFRVADWWILDHNISPSNIRLEVDEVIAVGIDFRSPTGTGDHKFTLHSIAAVGSYFARETMYFSIIVFWASYIFLEMLIHFIRLSRQEKLNQLKIGKLLAQSKSYQKQSETDNLTGALNRHGLSRVVERLEKKRNLYKYALLILDIDHFKLVNDQHGHQVGDAVLRELSEKIRGIIRSNDIFVRWGGEEFILFYRNKDEASSFLFAEKIRHAIEAHSFVSGKLKEMTVSIGLTNFLPREDFNTVLKRADVALYEAKESGRNKTVLK